MATASKTDLLGISWRLIATSPNGEVEVEQEGLGAGAGEVGAEVGRQRRLADPALGREDRDDLALLDRATARVADQPGREVAAAAQGLDEGRVVVGDDDLADAAAQGLGERGHVDPVTEQDDAQLGPVEPRRLGELTGLLEEHLRADDHLLDGGGSRGGRARPWPRSRGPGCHPRARTDIAPAHSSRRPRGCSLASPSGEHRQVGRR